MLLTLAAFILVLGVLIFVHELGHFMAAKAVGIAVPRFSIGFGPPTPLRFRRGETEYLISWIPFGGYVKMASLEEQQAMEALEGGELEEEFPPEQLFESKPLAARILVISAGVIMNVLFAWAAYSGLLAIYGPVESRILGSVEPGRPAAEAGLQEGDLVSHINGKELASWSDMVDVVQESVGESLAFTVQRGGEALDVMVTPVEAETSDPKTGATVRAGLIGVRPQGGVRQARLGVFDAVGEGARMTWDNGAQVLFFLKGMILGRVSAKQLGGPILIGQASGQFARAGLAALITFMAFLSVNLAIINLLPIPVLDGGHLVFLVLEGLRGGKPLPQLLRLRLTHIGLYLLLALMAFAVINDILRITGGP